MRASLRERIGTQSGLVKQSDYTGGVPKNNGSARQRTPSVKSAILPEDGEFKREKSGWGSRVKALHSVEL
jgi:hypothetical protein